MEKVSHVCDCCGTTEFNRKDSYFERSKVSINFSLKGGYVAEYEENEFQPIKLDLCVNCTRKLLQLIKDFTKNNEDE